MEYCEIRHTPNPQYPIQVLPSAKIGGTSRDGVRVTIRQRGYSKEELAQRGQAVYVSSIRQQVEAESDGKIAAIHLRDISAYAGLFS